MTISIYHLPEDIRAEFTIDEQGIAFASRRAVARLAGVADTTIYRAGEDRGLLADLAAAKSLTPILKPFAGQDFRDAAKLPDILVAAIIQHYAFNGYEQAQILTTAFAAIGFRVWVQQELGWQKPMTQAEFLLSVAQQFVEQERQLKLIQSQVKTVETKVENLTQQTEEIKKAQTSQDEVLLSLLANQKQAELDLQFVPFSAEEARQMTVRDKVVLLVRTYCYSSGVAYNQFFSHLYRQLKYRYHYDVKARSRNKRTSLIDQVEKDGMIDALYSIGSEIIKEKISQPS